MSDVYEHNKRELAELVEGDAVEFKRGLYSHWGIYIGNERVIHVTGIGEGGSSDASNPSHVSSACGKRFNKATVRIDNFFHVARGWKAVKNNSKDIDHPPMPVHEIIETAMARIGDIDYNLFDQNCEHFVSYCRNGTPLSGQVDTAKQTAEAGIMSAIIGFFLKKLGRRKKHKKDPQIENQNDDKSDKGPEPDNIGSDNGKNNFNLLEDDLNADGLDPRASNHRTNDLVSSSEYQNHATDVYTDADISTTSVADARTEESSSCQFLDDKRQNADPQFGSQSENKNDNDKGASGSNNPTSIDDSIDRLNILFPIVSYLKADGLDLRSPANNVGGNTKYLVSSSEAPNYVTGVDINPDNLTTNVADVGTVDYSKGRLADGKTEYCGGSVGDIIQIWPCSRGIDVNTWNLSLYQTRQNTVPQTKINDNSDKDKEGFFDSSMITFSAGILDPYVIGSDFHHLDTDVFTVSDYSIYTAIFTTNRSLYRSLLDRSYRSEQDSISDFESIPGFRVMFELYFTKMTNESRHCNFNDYRLAMQDVYNYDKGLIILPKMGSSLQYYVPQTCYQVGLNFTQSQRLIQ